ncbi:uncharacterized protein L201_003898 [Kwoniella dendrophila CBS 6074]|uniref:Nudix hydrolase domain-containing protein n=1 Tax=Kwoniella dendrophila CBS 6074 TaxID=1295534 RepID=A0AAX4JVQ7_9TREE
MNCQKTTKPTIKHSFKVHQSVTRFCLPLSRFNELPSNHGKSLHVGAFITRSTDINDTKQVLLVQNNSSTDNGKSSWDIPNGKCQFGIDQTLLESIPRIIKHQTGLNVIAIKKDIKPIEYPSGISNSPNQEICKQYNFVAEVDEKYLSQTDSPSSSSDQFQDLNYKWVSINELTEFDISDITRKVIQDGYQDLR